MKTKLVLTAFPFLALSVLSTGCTGEKYDVKLTIYNWEDYIYEGTDEMGNIVGDGTVAKFEKYYKEKTGKR